jgi:tRNA (cytidine/uridine-2'-O-)-methyltransferase
MFHIVLVTPEIPPNTGNVIRLAANTGCALHLVEPLGFAMEDRQLRRAGLDYHEYATLRAHDDLDAALADIASTSGEAPRVFALSTRGEVRFDAPRFRSGDAFLFGCETAGLPEDVFAAIPQDRRLRLPMRAGSRSLNLSNAVAVTVFEAWRQLGYAGGG